MKDLTAITLTAPHETRRTVFARGAVLEVPLQMSPSDAGAMIKDGRAVAGAVMLADLASAPAGAAKRGGRRGSKRG